jgi:hypothetical protein
MEVLKITKKGKTEDTGSGVIPSLLKRVPSCEPKSRR